MAVGASTRTTVVTESAVDIGAALRKKSRLGENLIFVYLFASGAISILTTLGIVFVSVHRLPLFLLRSLR